MARVWVVGSLNVDLVATVETFPAPGETVAARDFRTYPGGKGANQAVAASAAGAQVTLVGCVGDDDNGDRYRRGLVERGVDVGSLRVVSGLVTGHAVILVDARGENCIVVAAGANSALTPHDVEQASFGPGDVVLLQLEVPVDVVCRAIVKGHAAGATVVLNPSPFAVLPIDVLELCDVLVVNESEYAALTSAGLRHRSVVVTRGAAGAQWGEALVPSRAADVVDSTGAGDAFTGALSAALTLGVQHHEALGLAVAAGARAVEVRGAQGWELGGESPRIGGTQART